MFVSVDKQSGEITSFQHGGSGTGAHSYVMRLMGDNITFAFLMNTRPLLLGSFDELAMGNLSRVAKSIHNWPPYDLFA